MRTTHLEIRESFVRENQTTAEKYTGGQISGIRKGRDQRNRSHLPIVREYSRAHKQPAIQRCQVAKSQQSEINNEKKVTYNAVLNKVVLKLIMRQKYIQLFYHANDICLILI